MKKYIIYGLIFATVLAIIYMIYQRGQQEQPQQEQPKQPQPKPKTQEFISEESTKESTILLNDYLSRTESERQAYKDLNFWGKLDYITIPGFFRFQRTH